MVGIVTRLREYDLVVGYRKKVGRYTFYSPDYYWWTGKSIDFNREEAVSCLTNDYGLPVFENDVIQITDQGRPKYYHVQIPEKGTTILLDLLSGKRRTLSPRNERLSCKALFAGFHDKNLNYSILCQYADVQGLI